MIKSVLCALDISRPDAEKPVLETAVRLANMDGASLDVITVVPDYGMSVVGSYFDSDHTDKALDAAKQALNDMVSAAIGDEANAKVRHVVAIGNAYEEILKTAKASGADLVVIGAHKPDFRDYLLGPNAARVVRHSEASVYVVR